MSSPPSLSLSPQQQRSNVIRLAIRPALAGANSMVVYATGAVVGDMLAPNRALATLPISVFVVGMAACILPTGMFATRYGQRTAFLAGTGCGVLVELIAAVAVAVESFWLFCLATFFGGAYAAVVLSFRFAAADCVEPERRVRALSVVMCRHGRGRPQLVNVTMNLWLPHVFAATFLAQAAVAALLAMILAGMIITGLGIGSSFIGSIMSAQFDHECSECPECQGHRFWNRRSPRAALRRWCKRIEPDGRDHRFGVDRL